jgi:hypothetical protein
MADGWSDYSGIVSDHGFDYVFDLGSEILAHYRDLDIGSRRINGANFVWRAPSRQDLVAASHGHWTKNAR